jgi:hypothetical protein
MTSYTWTPRCAFLDYYFSFLQVQTSFSWTQKFFPELQPIVLKNSALIFLNFEAINSWALSIRILTLHYWIPEIKSAQTWWLITAFNQHKAYMRSCSKSLQKKQWILTENSSTFMISLFVRFIGRLLLISMPLLIVDRQRINENQSLKWLKGHSGTTSTSSCDQRWKLWNLWERRLKELRFCDILTASCVTSGPDV